MNTISQSASHWRDNPKFTVASSITAGESTPKVGDDEENNESGAVSDNGLTFDDFIDIINPLHHVPVIGTLYRKMTGDDLSSVSKVLGGSLFLGPLGAVSALANILVDEATGKDINEHAMALFGNTDSDQPKISSAGPAPIAIDNTQKLINIPFYSNDLTKKTNSEGHTDPVTAWAMAEVSFRKSASEQLPTAENATYGQQNMNRSFTSDTQTAAVTEWARAETSYRKAPFKPRPPSTEGTKLVTAHAPMTTPKNNVNDLSTLNNNLNAGGSLSIAHAAAKYSRQQSIPIQHHNLEVKIPTADTIATGGDWFSDTMLSALGKHNKIEKRIQ